MVGSSPVRPSLAPGRPDLGEPGADGRLAGQERGATGGAALLAVPVGEHRAFAADAVDVGRAGSPCCRGCRCSGSTTRCRRPTGRGCSACPWASRAPLGHASVGTVYWNAMARFSRSSGLMRWLWSSSPTSISTHATSPLKLAWRRSRSVTGEPNSLPRSSVSSAENRNRLGPLDAAVADPRRRRVERAPCRPCPARRRRRRTPSAPGGCPAGSASVALDVVALEPEEVVAVLAACRP